MERHKLIATKSPFKESITFRMDGTVLNRLKSHSEKNQISLNTLVNQIAKSFVEWESSAVGAGWMVFPKDAFKIILSKLSEQEIIKIAKETAPSTKDIRLLMTQKNEIESFFSILRNRSLKSGFKFDEIRNGDEVKFIIQHDMGKKWSIYSMTLYEEIIHSFERPVSFEHTDNTLIINIKMKN